MNRLRQASLPDGTRVFTVRPQEVAQLYPQVQAYCRHGIRVQEGDIVFDVGANIGLFALWLYRTAGANVMVYSFEPIPAIFEALRHNARRFGQENWKVFPCGLGRCAGRVAFGYCRQATALSSAYPDLSPEALVSLRTTLLRNADAWPAGVRWARRLPHFLLRPCVWTM
jgi:FkbM family methyltransferase